MAFTPYLDDESDALGYRPDPMGRVGRGQWGPNHPTDAFGRLPPDDRFEAFREAWRNGATIGQLFGDKAFRLKAPVAKNGENHRSDIAKLQVMLGRTGDLDVMSTQGPTGLYSFLLDDAIRSFQGNHGLAVDGVIKPNGETIRALGASLRHEVPRQGTTSSGSTDSGAGSKSDAGNPNDTASQGRIFADTRLSHMPAPVVTDKSLEEFSKQTGFGAKRANGYVSFFDGRSGTLVTHVPEDAAAELIHNFSSLSQRVTLLRLLSDPGRSLDAVAAAADRVLATIPEDQYKKQGTAAWSKHARAIPKRRNDDENARRAKAREAFREAVRALRRGEARQDVLQALQEHLFPEFHGDGRWLRDLGKDLAPGLGNARSIQHALNNFTLAREAIAKDDWSSARWHAALALLDVFGAVPGGNLVKAAGRSVVAVTPYGKNIVGAREFAKLRRQFEKAEEAIDAKQLFGSIYESLPTHVQERVKNDIRFAAGEAGERYALRIAQKIDPKATPRFYVRMPKTYGGPGKARIYDFSGRQLRTVILNDILRGYDKVRGKLPRKPTPGHVTEVKSISTDLSHQQRAIENWLSIHRGEVEKLHGRETNNVRVYREQIPLDFIIRDATVRFERMKKSGLLDDETAKALMTALRARWHSGIRKVQASDFADLIARLAASGLRTVDQGETQQEAP